MDKIILKWDKLITNFIQRVDIVLLLSLISIVVIGISYFIKYIVR